MVIASEIFCAAADCLICGARFGGSTRILSARLWAVISATVRVPFDKLHKPAIRAV